MKNNTPKTKSQMNNKEKSFSFTGENLTRTRSKWRRCS